MNRTHLLLASGIKNRNDSNRFEFDMHHSFVSFLYSMEKDQGYARRSNTFILCSDLSGYCTEFSTEKKNYSIKSNKINKILASFWFDWLHVNLSLNRSQGLSAPYESKSVFFIKFENIHIFKTNSTASLLLYEIRWVGVKSTTSYRMNHKP